MALLLLTAALFVANRRLMRVISHMWGTGFEVADNIVSKESDSTVDCNLGHANLSMLIPTCQSPYYEERHGNHQSAERCSRNVPWGLRRSTRLCRIVVYVWCGMHMALTQTLASWSSSLEGSSSFL